MAYKFSQPGEDPKYLARNLDKQEKTASVPDASEKKPFDGINSGFKGINSDVVRQREEARPPDNVDTTNPLNYANTDSQSSTNPKNRIKTITKKLGPSSLIIAFLIGGGAGVLFLISGAIAPVAFITNVMDDLNDQYAAMDISQGQLLRSKVSNSSGVAGCTKLSIRCKFKTMGSKQVEAYRRAGIDVTGDKAFTGRIKPTEFSFQGKKYTAAEWVGELKTNNDIRYATKRAMNMKFLGFNDKTFVGKTLKRFGISRKPPELTGTHRDRVNVLMGKAGVSSVDDLVFKPVTDDEGNPVDADGNSVDAKGNPIAIENQIFELEGDTSGTRYDYKQRNSMLDSIKKVASRVTTAKPPSAPKAVAVKALSVLGYADLACSLKNMIGAAGVAAKVANSAAMAKYIMPIASLAGKMQASEINEADALAIIEVFTQTDPRAQIPSLEPVGENEEVQMVENPNYGKSMMDSPLYKLASTGQLETLSSTEAAYSLGMGQNKLLSTVSTVASVANAIGDAVGCDFVQNGWVRGISLIAGVALAVGTAGTTLLIQGAISIGIMAGIMILDTMLNNALAGTVVHDDIDQSPMERAAIGFSGLSTISGETARSRGMMPGNAEQITNYLQVRNDINQDYIAIAKQDAKPFDIYDKYSFLGSFVQSITNYTNTSKNPMSVINNISSIVANALPITLGTNKALAKVVNVNRFTQCDDSGYTAEYMNIDADVQCNLRYIMSDEDLALTPDEVAEWMEDNQMVEPDTETGFPKDYTPIDPAEAQNFALGMVKGAVNSIYNTRRLNEYGYFLDYCAYRALPFGETYAESGAVGAPDEGWLNGSKCMEGEDVSYFRMYTLYKSTEAAINEEPVDVYVNAPAESTDGAPTGGSTVVSGDWAKPNDAGYNKITQDMNTSVSYVSGYPAGCKAGNCKHNGVDLAGGGISRPVYAACNGTATTAHTGQYVTADTNMIAIDCGGGVIVGYHHAVLTVGTSVTAGQVIGKTDSSGNWAGWHLHLTVIENGGFVDPVSFFSARGISLT